MDVVRVSCARNALREMGAIGSWIAVLFLGGVAAADAPDISFSGSEQLRTLMPAASNSSMADSDSISPTSYWAEDLTDEMNPEGEVAATNCDDCGPNYCCPNECRHGGYSLIDGWNCPIQSTDHCYDDFISPMTNPVYFEDPRNLTEARLIFLNHKVPLAAGGGDIQLYALQVRAALTDRLSLIATKDGYVVSSNPVVEDGWADVAAGLKYQLFADPATQTLLSTGVVYELPVGSHRSRQGNGGGAFDLFLTGGAEICCDGHWLSALGLVLPADESAESTWWYWSNHWDYEVARGIYTLAEVNWYHWLDGGDNGIPGIEGGDLFNFGSTGVAGNDIVSGAFGVKLKPNRNTEIGVAWELPLTERRDVLENRLTVDVIRRF